MKWTPASGQEVSHCCFQKGKGNCMLFLTEILLKNPSSDTDEDREGRQMGLLGCKEELNGKDRLARAKLSPGTLSLQ